MVEAKPTILRDEKLTVDGIILSRETLLAKDGKLSQELSITYPDSEHLSSRKFCTDNADFNKDNLLAIFDAHWDALKKEFKEIIEQANDYYRIKGINKGNGDIKICTAFLDDLSASLLEMQALDDISTGEFDKSQLPLTTLNQRLDSFRHNAKLMDIELDSFEKAIISLKSRFRKAEGFFEDVLEGASDDDNGSNNNLQFTSDADDTADNDTNWRGDQHLENDESWRGDEHPKDAEYDDPGKPKDGYDDDMYGQEQDGLSPLLASYQDHIADFIKAANEIWQNTAHQIHHHEPVTKDERNLEIMRAMLEDSIITYNEFKTALKEEGAVYDFRKCIRLLEDEEKGPMPKMRKILGTASNPRLLKILIEKSITKQKNDDMGLSA